MGLGNDVGCPYVTQYDFWRELCYFHKYCGVSNRFALYTATLRNAQLAGIGVAVEKGFQDGGDSLRREGYPIKSLAVIDSAENGVLWESKGEGEYTVDDITKADRGTEITLHLHPDGAHTVGVLDDLYVMGDIALRMVKDAIAAYVQVDLSTAAQVIARDDECDAMFSRISKEIAVYIVAHPDDAGTALDLFMIDKYLERLGDHAVNVAEWVEFLKTGVHKSRKIV